MKNENKTKPTGQDVVDFIAALPEKRQADAQELVSMMREISGEGPVMWGDRIVGFGTFHYKYPSGREGDWMQIGFASGKAAISLYLTYEADKLTSQVPGLGKFKIGKGCVYINTLADVDRAKLRKLIQIAYAAGNPFA